MFLADNKTLLTQRDGDGNDDSLSHSLLLLHHVAVLLHLVLVFLLLREDNRVG